MKKWEDFERPDLKAIPLFESIGWGIIFDHADVRSYRTSPENVPHHTVKFGVAGHHDKPQVRLHSWMDKNHAIQRQWELWSLDEAGSWKSRHECVDPEDMIFWLKGCGYDRMQSVQQGAEFHENASQLFKGE